MIPDEDLPMKMTPLPKKKTMMTMMKTRTTICPVEPKRTGDEADCNPVPVFPPTTSKLMASRAHPARPLYDESYSTSMLRAHPARLLMARPARPRRSGDEQPLAEMEMKTTPSPRVS
ncbi:uncharacterized protein TRAVEDRAFT_41193 [Trametes versicolor FP-101664 SS1]|uniref:uncharacterized protein n=1 Tax=Trametes versicolor (strain FP-101664) TaxID=717944 RepID=UPI0004623DCB|nr:uncharacterized protein TRAVEDRAFT_41193 [Trametes versicolor FP-101664 SS1]EIW63767.1 hypothetical protein TRAVEDRAFT_41193 [Trametes versicolor FP-101664 SS1]